MKSKHEVIEIYIYDEDWISDDLIAKASYSVQGLVQNKENTWHHMKNAKGKVLADISLTCNWISSRQNYNSMPTVLPMA